MFAMHENRECVQFFGNVFQSVVLAEKPIVVDGDLIADRVVAPSVRVVHGSLLCPDVHAASIHADIFGVFDLTQPYTGPATYTWLRPAKLPLPLESEWSNDISIERAAWWFLDPAITTHTAAIEPFIKRTLSRKSCGRARVLLYAAVEILAEHPECLTPLGQQVITQLAQYDKLPDDWRF